MASSTKNVKLGACKITYNGVDLGYTKGGVEAEVTTTTKAITVDQLGETTISEKITKRDIKVKIPLAETTLENLVAIMPGSTLKNDGGAGNARKFRVEVAPGISTNLLEIAQELVLHPVELADSNKTEDLVIFKAATAGGLKFSYQSDNERIFDCSFTGYPVPSEETVGWKRGLLFALGDTSFTAV
jgi:hypothetical protein